MNIDHNEDSDVLLGVASGLAAGLVGALVMIWIGFHLYGALVNGMGAFLTPRNLWNLSVQTASVAVMATGMVLTMAPSSGARGTAAPSAMMASAKRIDLIRFIPAAGRGPIAPTLAARCQGMVNGAVNHDFAGACRTCSIPC